MARTPKRSSVVPLSTLVRAPSPPSPLEEHGQRLWERIHARYRIDDPAAIAILHGACESLDRAQRAKAEIARDGVSITGPGGYLREHPAARIELQSRAFMARSLVRLGLSLEPVRGGPGRPPTGLGISWENLPNDDDS